MRNTRATALAAWSTRHEDTRTGRRADEVEFRAMKDGTSALSEALRDEHVDGSMIEENEVTSSNKYYRKAEVADERTAAVSKELQRRQEQLGKTWPFKLDGSTLRWKGWTKSLIYEFCLAVAEAPNLIKKPYNILPVTFEQASLEVLISWLGSHAEGIRTGWPRERGLPSKARELFTLVQKKTGGREWRWAPEPHLDQDPSSRDLKEEKLDLLVWLKMPGAHGHVYFAGQCACGSDNELETKAKELTVAGLRKWVKPPSFIPFVKCFFAPHVLPDNRLLDVIGEENATFDRARLALIGSRMAGQKAEKLKKKLQSAVELVLSGPKP